MSTTPHFGLPNDLNSGSTVLTSLPNKLNNLIDAQIPGILSIFGEGVVPNKTDDNSLLVTDGGGLSVDVDAGTAVMFSTNGTFIYGHNSSSYNVIGLIDNEVNYIYIKGQSIDGVPPLTTEEGTAAPIIFASLSYPLSNAVLLGTVTTLSGTVDDISFTDRVLLPFAQIQELIDAVGLPYTNADTIGTRLDAIETAVGALQDIIGAPSSGNTLDTLPVSSTDATDSKTYVDAQNAAQNTVIANNYSDLETAIATGGTSTVQTGFEQIAEEMASMDIGVTGVNPRWAIRSTASRAIIDVYGDGTDGSPTDLDAGTATIDHDAGTIGP